MTTKPTKSGTLSCLLRAIPQDLWDRARHRAIDDGTSLRELVLRAIREYLERKQS